jgi:alpha-D-ribose 1-methylphosphonate 5-phosphate C-P lyase
MTNRTPDPWKVEGVGINAIVRGADGTIVARRHRLPREVHEANAQLMAAAPALLAACQLVLSRWTFNDDQRHTHTWHDWADCKVVIEDAIKRAGHGQ